MFTGIIQAVGKVSSAGKKNEVLELTVISSFSDIMLGESIAVNGVCLTVKDFQRQLSETRLRFDVSRETIKNTTLASLARNQPVNLERAPTPTDRFGGHFVQGHVDAVGTVRKRQTSNEYLTFTVSFPENLKPYIVEKGSIALNGVSLTVVGVSGLSFTTHLIPHTISATNLGDLQPGHKLNLEVDILGKYVINSYQSKD